MDRKIKLLFVDDETRFLETLAKRLSLRDFDVTAATSAEEAISALESGKFEIALVDLKMPGMGGERLLELIAKRYPEMETIVLTGHGTIDSAVECTRNGAYRYLQKPCETEALLSTLSGAYQSYLGRKMRLDEQKMASILDSAGGASPLSILRRLRELSGDE